MLITYLVAILINLANTSKYSKCQVFTYRLLGGQNINQVLSPFVFLVSKKTGKFYLYLNKNRPKLIKTYNIASGKNIGRKEFAGDKRTPEGIYFADRFLDKNYLKKIVNVSKYGGFAISLSYPNPIDKLEHRTGHGIWIHGTDDNSRILKIRDSKGCVVMDNNNVIELAHLVQTRLTPVIIFDSFTPSSTVSFLPNAKLSKFLRIWQHAWETKDIDKFSELYASNYHNFRTGENKERFIAKKRYLSKKYKYIRVKLEKVEAFYSKYYTVVVFRQEYRSDFYKSSGIKYLYIKEVNNQYQIVSEDFVDSSDIKLYRF